MKKFLFPILIVLIIFVLTMEDSSNKRVNAGQDQNKKQSQKQFINPDDLHSHKSYTHVVTVNQAKMVYVAGQIALNNKGEVVGKGDLRAQTTQVFENLKIALAAAGATFADVVKISVYIANYKKGDINIFLDVRNKYMGDVNPPVSTVVGVQALAAEAFMVEIEVIAAVDK